MASSRRPDSGRPSVVTVRSAPGNPRRGLLSYGGITVPAALGRSGRTAFKREGDGATPIAAMRLLHGFYRSDRVMSPRTGLSMRRIGKEMLWCDQPDHQSYNRLVRAPLRVSHEEMKRDDGLYDICLVLDWNITSRRRYRGSAIFFHLIKPGYQPTAGCIAISLKDMRRLLPFLRRGTEVRVL